MNKLIISVLVVFALAIGYSFTPGIHFTAKPALPVTVETRNALMGPGRVVRISNNSSAMLPLTVEFMRGASHVRTEIVVNPGTVKEIGHMEGWAVAPGDTLKLASDKFASGQWNLQ